MRLPRTPSPEEWVRGSVPRRSFGRLPAPRQARPHAGSCIFYQGGGSVRSSPVTPPLFSSFSRLFQCTHAAASLSLLSLPPAPVSPLQFSEQLYSFSRRHSGLEHAIVHEEQRRAGDRHVFSCILTGCEIGPSIPATARPQGQPVLCIRVAVLGGKRAKEEMGQQFQTPALHCGEDHFRVLCYKLMVSGWG